jgi:hypothetical protein
MKSDSRVKLFLATALIVIVACGLMLHKFVLEPRARATQELSKMLELEAAIAADLEDYYKKHAEYPRSLKDLPLQNFHWGEEGSTPKDLDSFLYTSDGQTFVMSWKGGYKYSIYLTGKNGQLIFPEGETNKFPIAPINAH